MKHYFSHKTSIVNGQSSLWTWAVAIMLGLTACYSDDSTVADQLLPDITISGLDDSGYSVISFADNYLDITADVTTAYPESELDCRWYLIDRQAQYGTQDEDHPYEWEQIAEGKTLHYNVRLAPGEYEVVMVVTAANGYSVSKKVPLFVTTEFSEGYYILKETPDGNTELDLCNPETGLHLQNCLTARNGHPMDGAPEAVSTTISQGYIDDVTNTMATSNIVTVTTRNRQISVMRTSDLKEVMNNSNLLFTRFDDDEIPYAIVQCMWCNILITNKGIRSQYQASLDKGESGRYGITNGIHTSRYAAYERESSGLFLWDPENRNVVCCDYNGTARPGTKEENNLSTMNVYDCLYIGYCDASTDVVYVLRHRSGLLWVMTIRGGFSSGWKMQELKPIKAYAPNVSMANKFSVCTTQATLLYGINNGRIWAYDFINNNEREITPDGIADNETITYVSDHYVGRQENSYFVVGTQQGSNYTLRFYRNFGGQPDGQAVCTVSGTGLVRGLRYTTNDSMQSYLQAGLMD